MKEHKGLTAGKLTLMALGAVVGGSFFIGSSIAINTAGPAVLISYILSGILVYFILFALSEMTVANPDSGSFRSFAENEFGPALGFVVGWVYWTGITLAMSSEAVAASTLIKGWIKDAPLILIGSIIIILSTVLNLFGAEKLSSLENSLASIKLIAVVGFIVIGVALITGFFPGKPAVGLSVITDESLMPRGIGGIAGSTLIVMLSYAGFEIIGLAASETHDPHKNIPKAINATVIGLLSLYILAIITILFLAPTDMLTEENSPLVFSLARWDLNWVGGIINLVLITAILSTMLASTFSLGRMIRSLADKGHAPSWLKDTGDIPYRGIVFSGGSMLLSLFLSFILPAEVYRFLASSGGYSLLFTYLVILLTHYRFRKRNGCPPKGKCQLPGFPYTSYIAIVGLVIIIISMPLVRGQGYGLLAGISFTVLYALLYLIKAH